MGSVVVATFRKYHLPQGDMSITAFHVISNHYNALRVECSFPPSLGEES